MVASPEGAVPHWTSHLRKTSHEVSKELDKAITEELVNKPKAILVELEKGTNSASFR